MMARPSFAEMIRFNLDIVAQAQRLADAYAARVEGFAVHVGPHLRHVIEHYDALLDRSGDGLVDYDHRARDPDIERSPPLCHARLAAIATKLEALTTHSPNETLSVGFVIGVEGSAFCLSASTLARELNFVASHAIHHFAILRPLIADAGIDMPGHFGKAPETIRNERLQWAT